MGAAHRVVHGCSPEGDATAPDRGAGRGRERTVEAALYVSLAAFFLLFQQGAVVTLDGKSMVAVAHSLVHERSLAIPAEYGVLGEGGEHFGKHGPGMSLAVVPAVGLAAVVGRVAGRGDRAESFLASSMIPLIQAGVGLAIYRLARRLGGASGWSAAVAILALIGTYALPYGEDFFSEQLTTLCIAVAIERLVAQRELVAGLALALAVLTRLQTVVTVALFVVVVVTSEGVRRSLPVAARRAAPLFGPSLVAASLYLGYNALRFGDPLDTGYSGGLDTFTTNLLPGAGGLLLSPSKSVFLFCPLVVLVPVGLWRLRQRSPLAVRLVLANLLLTFVLVSAWRGWHGDFAWGPRLLLPGVLPALAVLAVLPGRYRRPALALGAVGFAVSASTLLVPLGAQQLDRPPPRGPAVVRQVTILPEVLRATAGTTVPGEEGDREATFVLGLWQVGFTRQLGAPGLVMAVVGTVVLAMLLVASAIRLRQASSLPGRAEREGSKWRPHPPRAAPDGGVDQDVRN